jgi:ribosomal protein L21E
MVLEGTGKFWEHTKGKLILYIPADVHKDSQFPFKPGEKVKITIEPERKKMMVDKI